MLLGIMPISLEHSYDEKECSFQNYKFYGPWVLVLGLGYNYYTDKNALSL